MESEAVARLAVDAAIDKKALDPVVLNLEGQGAYADFLVILTGKNDRHVDAIALGVDEALIEERRCFGNEGMKGGKWVLLDYADVVVHIFAASARKRYNIEELWQDVPRLALDIPDECHAPSDLYEMDGEDVHTWRVEVE